MAKLTTKMRVTIREQVLEYAQECPTGFIDEDLWRLRPSSPESSFRKRRTECTRDGLILDSGRNRHDSHGNPCNVWIHRKFVPNAPPVPPKIDKPPTPLEKLRRTAKTYRLALIAAAPHHQGGHSEVGRKIAEALGIPFPIRTENIPAS